MQASFIKLQYANDNMISTLSEKDVLAIRETIVDAQSGPQQRCQRDQHQVAPAINIYGESFKNVDHFAYLESHQHCFQSTSNAFMIFDDHNIHSNTKILVYKTIVLPTLPYGSEFWLMCRIPPKTLERYHKHCT